MSGNNRNKRVPLGAPRLRLAVKGKQGYKRRWINDRDGRVQRAIEGGYRLVAKDGAEFKDDDAANRNDSLGDAMSKLVDSDGTKAYLMEISTAMYTSDQMLKQKHIDETEDALRVGADSHGKAGSDGRYVPKEGIKIKQG